MELAAIDNDLFSCRNIANILHSAGYVVKEYHSGPEALTALSKNRTQLVVCDHKMAGTEGLDLCRSIRKSILHQIYIVSLTCPDSPESVFDALEAGADDCLPKTCSPSELIGSVNTGRSMISTEDTAAALVPPVEEIRVREATSHLERVRQYCFLLAQELRNRPRYRRLINNQFVRLIYETSPLHDIGRIDVPESILLNPGRLTPEEFEVMKTHTLHGANRLAVAINQFPKAGFLQMAYDIALCHHERYNGHGYPAGLAGDNIPLCARIVALADVYDALSTKRGYKRVLSHSEARDLIVSEAGKHFDPGIVDAFVDIEHEFLAVREGFLKSEAEIEELLSTRLTSAFQTW
ncbi:MAG: HD domain-containing phosphohydrolase [Planctomycetaceae bacterium]